MSEVENLLKELVKNDGKTIDALKVTIAIWKNRTNPTIVKQVTELFSKFVDEKKVLSEIEFYLPQLAHMIIHLDIDWSSKSLEHFAVVISQASFHCALQLCFILVASIEDYQPEDGKGNKNPNFSESLFFRSVKLLNNVQRAIVFGTPTLTAQEESLLLTQFSANKFEELQDFERTERALQIINSSKDPITSISSSHLNGTLYYKRLYRKSSLHSKGWKARFFRIQDRILYCYGDQNTNVLKRAIPLEDCIIQEELSKKQSFVFSVEKKVLNMKFLLRANDKAAMLQWISLLRAESNCPPEPIISETSKAAMDSQLVGVSGDKAISTSINLIHQYEKNMTPGQKIRFKYLQQQRIFTSRLAEIAEDLRFKEVSVRKFYLRRMMHDLIIPPFVYLPLCRSTDTWTYVIRSLPANCRVFKTKARCPCLMLFEVEEHHRGIDVAAFINAELHEYDYASVAASTMVEIKTDLNLIKDEEEHEHQIDLESKPSLFSKRNSENASLTVWRVEGTGMNRLGVTGGAISLPNSDSTNHENSHLHSHLNHKSAESQSSSADGTVSKNEFSLIGPRFADKNAKLRTQSPYGHLPNWKIDGLIAKSNDDVRQEVFLMQLMLYIQNAFKLETNSLWLYTYRILSTTKSTGLIQLIPDAISIDELKKSPDYAGSLRLHFEKTFGYVGGPEPPALRNAIEKYVQSMAAYSIVSYALAIKDRHNGNIMIDADGHIIHIDFGFILGIAPGKQFSMEKAPFKLTEEMANVMGGRFSADFVEYSRLCTQALKIIRKNVDAISLLMEIMQSNSNFPCFRYNKNAIKDFRNRMMLNIPEQDIEYEVNKLIRKSYRHGGTKFYDDFQLATNGILP